MKARGKHGKAWRIIGLVLVILAGSFSAFQIWKRAAVSAEAPRIALSLDTTWYNQLGFSQAAYEIAVIRAGGRPVPFRPGKTTPERILDSVDALLLCGGGDVDPSLYGEPSDRGAHVDETHDDLELALISGALERDLPILGICRGIQILNVAHGGSVRFLGKDPKLGPTHGITLRSLSAHPVRVSAGSRLAAILGRRAFRVTSFHVRAVGRLGGGLRVAARSPDGVIEAVEREDRNFVLGVQWHPEVESLADSRDLAIFRAFVDAARQSRAARGQLSGSLGSAAKSRI